MATETRITTTSTIGKEIQKVRRLQGLTQHELACIAGTGTRFISDLERGKKNINLGKVLLVLGALGLGLYLVNKMGKK